MIGWIGWLLVSIAAGVFGAWLTKLDFRSRWTWWLLLPGLLTTVIVGLFLSIIFSLLGIPPFGGE
jgi:ABC-type tungstate transport system substrate-binding protein